MVDGGSPRILRPGEAVPLEELGGAHAAEGDLHVTPAAPATDDAEVSRDPQC